MQTRTAMLQQVLASHELAYVWCLPCCSSQLSITAVHASMHVYSKPTYKDEPNSNSLQIQEKVHMPVLLSRKTLHLP